MWLSVLSLAIFVIGIFCLVLWGSVDVIELWVSNRCFDNLCEMFAFWQLQHFLMKMLINLGEFCLYIFMNIPVLQIFCPFFFKISIYCHIFNNILYWLMCIYYFPYSSQFLITCLTEGFSVSFLDTNVPVCSPTCSKGMSVKFACGFWGKKVESLDIRNAHRQAKHNTEVVWRLHSYTHTQFPHTVHCDGLYKSTPLSLV